MFALSPFRLQNFVQLLAALIVALAWVFVPGVYTFFISVLIVWAAFRLDSRMVAGSALALLVLIPVLLATDNQDKAEQFAVYVFFLLSITVVLQILETLREPSFALSPAANHMQILVPRFRANPSSSEEPAHPRRKRFQDMVSVRVAPKHDLLRAQIDGIIPRSLFRI